MGDTGSRATSEGIGEAVGVVGVGGGDPVESGVTVRRSVSQAGGEERRADATIAKRRVDEEVVHDQDAIGKKRVQAGVKAGEALKPAIRVGHELDPESRIPLEDIEQAL